MHMYGDTLYDNMIIIIIIMIMIMKKNVTLEQSTGIMKPQQKPQTS